MMLEASSEVPTSTTTTQNPQKDFEEETLHLSLANAWLSVEISDAADAFDSLGSVFKQSNLLAQIAHMRIDAAIERREFAAEYIARQLLAANNLAGRLQQHLQQIEFYGRKIQDLVTPANNSGAVIHFDIPDDNWSRDGLAAVSCHRFCAPQNRADASNQLLRIKRLGQVIVRAHFQTQHAIQRITFGSQHQNGNARLSANPAQHIKTVYAGHHHIQYNQRVIAGQGRFRPRSTAVYRLDLKSLLSQITC